MLNNSALCKNLPQNFFLGWGHGWGEFNNLLVGNLENLDDKR